jgi:hypothetical protein
MINFLSRLFGGDKGESRPQHRPLYEDQPLYSQSQHGNTHAPHHSGAYSTHTSGTPTGSADEQAIARYRYMLRTAPPETIEQAHEEAFAKLTPEQRQLVLRELNNTLPAHERAAEGQDDSRTLARLATRAELRQPGTLERTLGGGGRMGGMMGAGGMMVGGIFAALAAGFVGSMIAEQFMEGMGEDFAAEELGGDMMADAGLEETMVAEEGFGGFGDFGGEEF